MEEILFFGAVLSIGVLTFWGVSKVVDWINFVPKEKNGQES